MSNDGTGLRDAELDARTIYDIACIRADASNATREDVEFKAIALRNYKAIAALSAVAPPPVLEGMVLVPREPAPALLRKFLGNVDMDDAALSYAAMLADSPAPAQPEGGEACPICEGTGRVDSVRKCCGPPRELDEPQRCNRPPAGWYCGLERGHEGPCPAWPVSHKTADDFYTRRPAPAQQAVTDEMVREWRDRNGLNIGFADAACAIDDARSLHMLTSNAAASAADAQEGE